MQELDGDAVDEDGTHSFLVGYLNRNRAQEVDVPIGSANAFEPGTDRGQPTHFLPRRQRFVFTVSLPIASDDDHSR